MTERHKRRGDMTGRIHLLAGLMLAALMAVALVAVAQDPEENPGFLAAKGRVTFRVYCASCHGTSAEGNGNVAQFLTVQPANLKLISERNDGFSPELIYDIIDGRKDVRGHGAKEMPIWGDVFQDPLVEEPGYQETGEQRVGRKIRELVYYLESIQVEE